MPPSPTRHRLALALALAGIALSALALDVHRRLAAGSGYTSFCNLGGAVNCDVVLGSRYSVVLGVAVPAWGIAGLAPRAPLALPRALAPSAGGPADLPLLRLASPSPRLAPPPRPPAGGAPQPRLPSQGRPGGAARHRGFLRLPVPFRRAGLPRPARGGAPARRGGPGLRALPPRRELQPPREGVAPSRRLPRRVR